MTVLQQSNKISLERGPMETLECIRTRRSIRKYKSDPVPEELLEHGVNRSHTHVDFMIGADDLNVWGVRSDGSEEAIFVDGQWAWENEYSGNTW